MIVGIVGYRKYDNYEDFKQIINSWIGEKTIDKIVSGAASGVDTLAERYAAENGIKTEIYPAEWSKYGRKAGPIRNQIIVNVSDVIFAFPSRKSVGTFDTINRAKHKGIPVYINYVDI